MLQPCGEPIPCSLPVLGAFQGPTATSHNMHDMPHRHYVKDVCRLRLRSSAKFRVEITQVDKACEPRKQQHRYESCFGI